LSTILLVHCNTFGFWVEVATFDQTISHNSFSFLIESKQSKCVD